MRLFSRRVASTTDAATLAQAGPRRLGDLLAPDAFQVAADHAIFDGMHATTVALTRLPSAAPIDWFAMAKAQLEACDIATLFEPRPSGAMKRQLRRELAKLQGAKIQADRDGLVEDSARKKAIDQLTRLADRLEYDERVLRASVYMTLYAQGKQALERRVTAVEAQFGTFSAGTTRMVLEVLRGLRCTLPTAEVHADHGAEIPATAAASLASFSAPHLIMPGGIWFGVNRQNGEPVIVDPFASRVFDNAHGAVIAKSRAGKSTFLKTVFEIRAREDGAHVVTLDPEEEHSGLAAAMGGQVINLAPGSGHCINPLDMPHSPQATGEEHSIFKRHVEDVQGFLNVILAGKGKDLDTTEKAILDDAITQTYASGGISEDHTTHNRTPPTLIDLMDTLNRLDSDYKLGLRLRRYATGALSSLFGGQTNVDLSNAFTVFTMRGLSRDLWPAAMYVVNQFVWTQAYRDHTIRRYYIADEAQHILSEPSGAGNRLCSEVVARGAKYGYGVILATQHARPFLEASAGLDLLANASWTLLLAQEEAGIAALREYTTLSDEDAHYLTSQCDKGQGLLITPNPYRRSAEKVGVYVSIRFSKEMELYVRRDRETPLLRTTARSIPLHQARPAESATPAR